MFSLKQNQTKLIDTLLRQRKTDVRLINRLVGITHQNNSFFFFSICNRLLWLLRALFNSAKKSK